MATVNHETEQTMLEQTNQNGEQNEIISKLKEAVEGLQKEIQGLDKIMEDTQAKKSQLQQMLQETLKSFGVAPEAKTPQKRGPRDGKSIRQLITEYLQQHKEAKTKDISAFLAAQGKKTNPGAELSKLAKDKVIVSKERGVYAISNS